MNYYDNPYTKPEKFGLKILVEIDYSSGNYEFDLRVVWQTEDGRLVTARDSGCSCPVPFEDFSSVAELDDFYLNTILAEIDSEISGSRGRWEHFSVGEAAEARRQLRELV